MDSDVIQSIGDDGASSRSCEVFGEYRQFVLDDKRHNDEKCAVDNIKCTVSGGGVMGGC